MNNTIHGTGMGALFSRAILVLILFVSPSSAASGAVPDFRIKKMDSDVSARGLAVKSGSEELPINDSFQIGLPPSYASPANLDKHFSDEAVVGEAGGAVVRSSADVVHSRSAVPVAGESDRYSQLNLVSSVAISAESNLPEGAAKTKAFSNFDAEIEVLESQWLGFSGEIVQPLAGEVSVAISDVSGGDPGQELLRIDLAGPFDETLWLEAGHSYRLQAGVGGQDLAIVSIGDGTTALMFKPIAIDVAAEGVSTSRSVGRVELSVPEPDLLSQTFGAGLLVLLALSIWRGSASGKSSPDPS